MLADPPKRPPVKLPTPTPDPPELRPTVRLNNVDIDLEDSAEITAAHVRAMLAQTNRKADGYAKATRCTSIADSSLRLKKGTTGNSESAPPGTG